MGQDAAAKILPELLLHEVRKRAAALLLHLLEEGLEVFLHDLVKDTALGLVALIGVAAKGRSSGHGPLLCNRPPSVNSMLETAGVRKVSHSGQRGPDIMGLPVTPLLTAETAVVVIMFSPRNRARGGWMSRVSGTGENAGPPYLALPVFR